MRQVPRLPQFGLAEMHCETILVGLTWTISQHVVEVMDQIEKVHKMGAEERVEITIALHTLFKKVQGGVIIIDPLYPDTDLVTATVVQYRKSLKRTDVRDDPPSQFPFIV